ncbi:hypothetical protein KM043_017851 [Ampulex compressa]|nr:hypothetical protein KM043_017851 [Ampulex compressa]
MCHGDTLSISLFRSAPTRRRPGFWLSQHQHATQNSLAYRRYRVAFSRLTYTYRTNPAGAKVSGSLASSAPRLRASLPLPLRRDRFEEADRCARLPREPRESRRCRWKIGQAESRFPSFRFDRNACAYSPILPVVTSQRRKELDRSQT